jgi:hypothetical protein
VGIVSAVFALFTDGYILGVWTAGLAFRQSQLEHEEGAPARHPSIQLIALGSQSRMADTLR